MWFWKKKEPVIELPKPVIEPAEPEEVPDEPHVVAFYSLDLLEDGNANIEVAWVPEIDRNALSVFLHNCVVPQPNLVHRILKKSQEFALENQDIQRFQYALDYIQKNIDLKNSREEFMKPSHVIRHNIALNQMEAEAEEE